MTGSLPKAEAISYCPTSLLYFATNGFIRGLYDAEGAFRTLGNLAVSGNLSVGSLPFGDYRNVQWNSETGHFYYDNSSRKHKRDITPLVDDFLLLLQAKAMTYTSPNAPGRWEIGFIAEDFDKIGLKRLVDYGKGGEVEGINYEKICLYLTEIAKTQQREIETLKFHYKENDALKKANESKNDEMGELRTVIEALAKRVNALEAGQRR